MTGPVVLHEPTPRYAYPLGEHSIRLCVCVTPQHWKCLQVRYRNKNRPDDAWHSQVMEQVGFDGTFATYEVTLPVAEKSCYLLYDFRMTTDVCEWFFCAYGLFDHEQAQGHFEYLCIQYIGIMPADALTLFTQICVKAIQMLRSDILDLHSAQRRVDTI